MITEINKPDKPYKVVGSRPIRHDGVDKVTGKALYGADILVSGTLHGKVLRSPYAHARIKNIDTSRAQNHPGVLAVTTALDIAPSGPVVKKPILGQTPAENVLARHKVLYKGHAVAAVAATTVHDAEEALDLIEIEYEPLQSVTNVEDAMAKDAPILHENWTSENQTGGTNIGDNEQHTHGNLEMP